jgi:Cys-tRNA(Pro)/Cys-tRNA(Cys) deacylase
MHECAEKGMIKNNITRMLDAKGIQYQTHELPNMKLGAFEVAQFLGVNPEVVYKTIVVTREAIGKPILALVPGSGEVDLKALARALGEKKVHLATHKQAEQLTGMQTGGISPLATLTWGFQVVVDSSIQTTAEIYISGGQRGLNVCLSPEALMSITNALVAEISR